MAAYIPRQTSQKMAGDSQEIDVHEQAPSCLVSTSETRGTSVPCLAQEHVEINDSIYIHTQVDTLSSLEGVDVYKRSTLARRR